MEVRTIKSTSEEYLMWLQVERRFANNLINDKIKVPMSVPTSVGTVKK